MLHHSVRPMTVSDLEQVLQWRNHPDVRRYMYTTHEISSSEHSEWYARASVNPAVTLLIYQQDGQAQGFVSFSRTRSWPVAEWGFYLAPDAPKGSGRALAGQALNYAFTEMMLQKVCGQALGFNKRSIGFHTALGFHQEGRLRAQHFDGQAFHDVVCFGLLRDEWQVQIKE